MDALDRKLLLRLLDSPEKLSRNKNFQLYSDPRTHRLRRVARHLQSIRELIEGADKHSLRIVDLDDGVEVVHDDTLRNARRRARLTGTEWEMLLSVLQDDVRARAIRSLQRGE